MNRQQPLLAARGLTDKRDRLLTADEPLAELHESCGGTLPGTLAVPELLELVRRGRSMGLKIARDFSAFDGEEIVSGFVRVHPLSEGEGGGCELLVENWQRVAQTPASAREMAEQLDEIDRAAAEVTARLDAKQCVQFLSATAPDTSELQEAVAKMPGKAWSEYVELQGVAHRQPLHWRLVDGGSCRIPGSTRDWRVRLLPVGPSNIAPRAFELLLVADDPVSSNEDENEAAAPPGQSRLIGSALTPVLQQPISRIIANAETIRARLAGPLRAEYSEYAGSIAQAGQHLSAMLADLSDLEVVEAPGFTTVRETVDLTDAAQRAMGILGVRAQARNIKVTMAGDEPVLATAEFRRVLQILINLIGNAIAYSPEGTCVTVASSVESSRKVSVCVRDEGPGIDEDQAARIFEKFERLGRDKDGGNDSGSGLGLYISRKLALAMDGDLEVVQNASADPKAGADFKLTLGAAPKGA